MKLYNTLTKKKEDFVPVVEGEVRMYNCGPTVYNFFHIGNARNFIVFDCLRRYFEYKGYKVTFVQNFTDIDDKMIGRANEEGITVKELGDRFIEEYYRDANALGIRKADKHPRATENIGQMMGFIKKLEAKGLAYAVDGDVYFNTREFKQYGELSGQNIEDLEAGARIDVDVRKKNPTDFALWKSAKPGEPSWKSPWGEGRPGWHIECSVMATQHLGDTIDIHSGGQDLIFPHHENEKAQSEGATGKPFARYWLHNGYLNIDNQKMSKSLGNFFTVRDIEKEYDPEIIRLFMLSAHYRNPLNFSREQLEQTKSALERLYNAKTNLEFMMDRAEAAPISEDECAMLERINGYVTQFEQAMDDDINTADATAAIFDLVRDINTHVKAGTFAFLDSIYAIFMRLTEVLGIARKDSASISPEIQTFIDARQKAREEKNWAKADEIREQLLQKGIVLEDTPDGVKVKRK